MGKKECFVVAIFRSKKEELVKTKTDLHQRKSAFGRRGNNWIEPMRDWIKTAHHAKKIALTKDFLEIKSLSEKIGTNRLLLDKKILFNFQSPFDLIAKHRKNCNHCDTESVASERIKNAEKSESLIWSGCPESNRDYPSSKFACWRIATGQARTFTPHQFQCRGTEN